MKKGSIENKSVVGTLTAIAAGVTAIAEAPKAGENIRKIVNIIRNKDK